MAKVKIKDNQTGKILEVDDTQLGQYGLGQQPQQMQPQLQQVLQPGMQQPQTQQPLNPQLQEALQPGMEQPQSDRSKYITGHSLQEIQDTLNAARAAGNKTDIKYLEDDYDKEYKYQQDFGKKDTTSKKESVTLRKEFSKESKDLGFQDAQKSWTRASTADKTGAGDLTVIYSYIKALDPTSVVREGEINLTKAAESVPNNVIRAYQRAKEGKIMSDELRGEMLSELGGMYNERANKQKELNAFYTGLASDSGIDPNDVVGKIGEIKLAEIPKKEEIKPKSIVEKVSGGAGFLYDTLLGQSQKVARDVVAGKMAPSINESSNSAIQTAQQTMKLWEKETDPTKKKALYDQAQSLLAQSSKQSGEIGKEFSTDVKENPLKRAAVSAVEIASTAKLLTDLPTILKSVKNAGGNIKHIKNPTKAFVEARDLAVKKYPTMDIKSVIEAGDKAAKLNPAGAADWEVAKTALSKSGKMPTKDLLQMLTDWGSQTYDKSGDVKGKAAAAIYNRVYQAGRTAIQTQAPEVASHTGKLAFLKNLPKNTQKATWLALKAVGLGKLVGL